MKEYQNLIGRIIIAAVIIAGAIDSAGVNIQQGFHLAGDLLR